MRGGAAPGVRRGGVERCMMTRQRNGEDGDFKNNGFELHSGRDGLLP